jgi:hypothetical protein
MANAASILEALSLSVTVKGDASLIKYLYSRQARHYTTHFTQLAYYIFRLHKHCRIHTKKI